MNLDARQELCRDCTFVHNLEEEIHLEVVGGHVVLDLESCVEVDVRRSLSVAASSVEVIGS